MPVIAMTHEMGSLAKDVALQLAQELNLSVMRHEVVEHVADRMHVHSSLINRLREGKVGLIERFRAGLVAELPQLARTLTQEVGKPISQSRNEINGLLARIDFFLTEHGPVINEINTLPGFTPVSMFPSLWEASGLAYGDLITELIESALEAER